MTPATAAVRTALNKRFQAPEWALFFEVSQGTGSYGGRFADAVAMNLFPSRGLRVEGVEIKVSRGDWLRELRDPSKSEPIQRYCDHWWIAALPGIVADGELPPTWGLLELNANNGLRMKVKAPKLEAEPLGRDFLAAMVRRAAEKASRELNEAVKRATEEERASIEARIAERVKFSTSRHRELETAVEEFEKASGLSISGWSGGKEVGDAVRIVRDLGLTSVYGGVRGLADQARRFAEKADGLLASLPAEAQDEAA
jgi:hypothetical protein